MKILITGASGFVGTKVLTMLSRRHQVIGMGYRHVAKELIALDLTQESLVNAVLKEIRPEMVIHSAALANPDYCEEHPEEAKIINVLGTKYVADACNQMGPKLIYVSTMAVFDGTNPPYGENATPSPVNEGLKRIQKQYLQ